MFDSPECYSNYGISGIYSMRFAPGGRMPGTKRNDEGIFLATRLVFETTKKKWT